MDSTDACRTVAPFIAGYINNDLSEEEFKRTKAHLSTCPICRGIADALDMAARAGRSPRVDLGLKLHSQLELIEADAQLHLEFPRITWQISLACAIAVLILMITPDPWMLLAAFGFF